MNTSAQRSEFQRSRRTFIAVWLALLALLALTCASALIDLGALNAAINMAIAAAKALLVLAFFMHLRSASALLRIVGAVALAALVLLFALSATDYATRERRDAPYQSPHVLKQSETSAVRLTRGTTRR